MTKPEDPRPRGRPRGTRMALSAARELKLIHELRDSPSPVNLSATAKAYGISRGTLLRYVKEEPGLLELLQARRAEQGRGYVPVSRGTRATRAAAKARLEAQQAAPRAAKVDPTPPPALMAKLTRMAEEFDEFERWSEEMGEDT